MVFTARHEPLLNHEPEFLLDAQRQWIPYYRSLADASPLPVSLHRTRGPVAPQHLSGNHGGKCTTHAEIRALAANWLEAVEAVAEYEVVAVTRLALVSGEQTAASRRARVEHCQAASKLTG
jgi:hypothetical protein